MALPFAVNPTTNSHDAAAPRDCNRKSPRVRKSPSLYVARPSQQGFGVEEGDRAFLTSGLGRVGPPERHSKRVRERQEEAASLVDIGGGADHRHSKRNRAFPLDDGTNSSTLHNGNNKDTTNDDCTSERKQPPTKPPSTAPKARNKQPVGSSAPRPPRVIVIGAGISGLACARELSERRHDVLVLEARERIGGRLRTIDLMLDKEWTDEKETSSDLYKVHNWSPVDVGGAFIHGTGLDTYENNAPSTGVDARQVTTPPPRKSKRIHNTNKKQPYKHDNEKLENGKNDNLHIRRSDDGIGSLNPVYVLARQKLRLPVHEASEHAVLVDHHGNLVSEEVDRQVAEEFNEVLDLATKCCEQGKYEWREETAATKLSNTVSQKPVSGSAATASTPNANGKSVQRHETAEIPGIRNASSAKSGAKIDPATDFGEIFDECRKKSATRTNADNQEKEKVRNNLFQWHVANLEMSSGAPMEKLGQKWNADEPFGYGGDHSYLEGGFRDVIEALAEGFDCRGIQDVASANESKNLRRSGDVASMFGRQRPVIAGNHVNSSRGLIECGIEVNSVKVIENEEVRLLRKQKKQDAPTAKDSLRRSNRDNRGTKMASFLDSLMSRSKGEQNTMAQPSPSTPTNDETSSIPTSSYGNQQNSCVQVTTKCGLTLEADAVIITVPLAILSIPVGSPGHISFSPPLPRKKQNALNRLGVGVYNRCCMSFQKSFWNSIVSSNSPGKWDDETTKGFAFIGHASAEHGKDILFFKMRNDPILIAIYGGSEYSKSIESMHDEAVVAECMKVLRKICSKAKAGDDSMKTRRQVDLTVPDWPIDYFVSRWGSDPYSRGAFCYVPPGVNGFKELRNMSRPIHDFRPKWATESAKKPKRPLILFAGEATTPYHPSTIHGAFETGIREAYRLDLALEPELSGITFDEASLYQPTFSVRRVQSEPTISSQETLPNINNDTKTKSWWFDHDASILRGVESFGLSAGTMSVIKSKILAPACDTHSVDEMLDRYKLLMDTITKERHTQTSDCESKSLSSGGSKPPFNSSKWDLPGQRGTWLASDVAQKLNKNVNARPGVPVKDKPVTIQRNSKARVAPQTGRSSRKIQRKADESFIFY